MEGGHNLVLYMHLFSALLTTVHTRSILILSHFTDEDLEAENRYLVQDHAMI